jgi:surface protein
MVNKTEVFHRPKTKRELQDLLKDDNVIPNNIDTCLIENMSELFKDNREFNKPINKWNTKKVTTMREMFRGATSFNQKIVVVAQRPFIMGILLMGYKGNGAKLPTEMLGKISEYVIEMGWDTGNVFDMSNMFRKAVSFNQPVEMLDTNSVICMRGMFGGATSFNQPVEGLDTSKMTDMRGMFSRATSFNQPVEGLNTMNVEDISHMFRNATSFNQPVEGLNTINVTNMSHIFYGATSFNHPIEGLDTRNATNTVNMLSKQRAPNHRDSMWYQVV